MRRMNDQYRILRPEQALDDLSQYVADHDPHDGTNIRHFSTDLRDRSRRHWCPEHGWVQPYAGRLCAYCMPVMDDDLQSAKVVVFDRMTGMPVINPS